MLTIWFTYLASHTIIWSHLLNRPDDGGGDIQKLKKIKLGLKNCNRNRTQYELSFECRLIRNKTNKFAFFQTLLITNVH